MKRDSWERADSSHSGKFLQAKNNSVSSIPHTGLQLRSLIKHSGELELSLIESPLPEVGPDDVLVRVEGAPLNPTDLSLLFGSADMKTRGSAVRLTARLSQLLFPKPVLLPWPAG